MSPPYVHLFSAFRSSLALNPLYSLPCVGGVQKSEKNSKSNQDKCKKAMEKGNMDGARIYAESAIREKNQALNCIEHTHTSLFIPLYSPRLIHSRLFVCCRFASVEPHRRRRTAR